LPLVRWILPIVGAIAGVIAILTTISGVFNAASQTFGVDKHGNTYTYNPSPDLRKHYQCITKSEAVTNSYFLYSMPPDVLPADVHPFWTYYLACITGGFDQKFFIYTPYIANTSDQVGMCEYCNNQISILIQQSTEPLIAGKTIVEKNDKYTIIQQGNDNNPDRIWVNDNHRTISYLIQGAGYANLLNIAMSIK